MSNGEYITLAGIAIQTVLYLLGGYAIVIRAGVGADHLNDEVKIMQEEMKELSKVITKLAVQSERMDSMSKRMNMQEARMDELSRGVGWKQARKIVDGEYGP